MQGCELHRGRAREVSPLSSLLHALGWLGVGASPSATLGCGQPSRFISPALGLLPDHPTGHSRIHVPVSRLQPGLRSSPHPPCPSLLASRQIPFTAKLSISGSCQPCAGHWAQYMHGQATPRGDARSPGVNARTDKHSARGAHSWNALRAEGGRHEAPRGGASRVLVEAEKSGRASRRRWCSCHLEDELSSETHTPHPSPCLRPSRHSLRPHAARPLFLSRSKLPRSHRSRLSPSSREGPRELRAHGRLHDLGTPQSQAASCADTLPRPGA